MDEEKSGPGRPDPGGDAPDDESLSGQRARLARLVAAEEALRALRAAEQALEVERIAADVALEAARPNAPPKLDPSVAGLLADALAARREAAERLARRHGEGAGEDDASREFERLRAGREALADWLDAPRRDPRNRIPRAAHAVLVVGCAATMLAAIAVHPVFLVVLIPLGLPLGYLAMSGQDTVWLRVGAERRYRTTGLAGPGGWTAAAVEARLAALEAETAEAGRRHDEARTTLESPGAQAEAMEAEIEETAALADAETAVRDALGRAGLEDGALDPATERWLGLVFETRHARRELDAARARREALGTEAERLRDRIFRFLSRRGEASPEGHADAGSLAAGLDRVERRDPGDGSRTRH